MVFETVSIKRLLLKQRKMPIKLTSETFGLVYHTEGKVSGERKYQVLRYVIEEFENVELELIDGNIEVCLQGNQVEATDSAVFDEKRSKTKMEVAMKSSKVAANIGKFLKGIAAIIYPGLSISYFLDIIQVHLRHWIGNIISAW